MDTATTANNAAYPARTNPAPTWGSGRTVLSATVITDRFSGQSRGFGFVEMESNEEANNAISQLGTAGFGLLNGIGNLFNRG